MQQSLQALIPPKWTCMILHAGWSCLFAFNIKAHRLEKGFSLSFPIGRSRVKWRFLFHRQRTENQWNKVIHSLVVAFKARRSSGFNRQHAVDLAVGHHIIDTNHRHKTSFLSTVINQLCKGERMMQGKIRAWGYGQCDPIRAPCSFIAMLAIWYYHDPYGDRKKNPISRIFEALVWFLPFYPIPS